MTLYRHLPAVPAAQVDDEGQEIVDVGAQRRGILEELEKAHLYIQELHQALDGLRSANQALESRLTELEGRVDAEQ